MRPSPGRGLPCSPRRCYICHEIGSGPYYAYLWGEELRAYFELPQAGHMLATNLHADTYEEARDQICAENGVPEAALRRMQLMFFLSVKRSGWSGHPQDRDRLGKRRLERSQADLHCRRPGRGSQPGLLAEDSMAMRHWQFPTPKASNWSSTISKRSEGSAMGWASRAFPTGI